MVVSRAALLGLWTWRDCVKCVMAQRQLHSRSADCRIARRRRRNVLRAGDLMPCQRVLAPVTGAGPPQAAETAAAQVPPGWSRRRRDPGRHVMGLPVHAVAYR